MQWQEKSSQIVTSPQILKDNLYGAADTGWLTIFYTPSRRNVWVPVTNAVPDLDLKQNCYLGLGIRRQPTDNHLTRGKADDIIAIPGLWLDLDYQSPGAHNTQHPLAQIEGAALSLLDAAPYKPSIIVHSGHGLHVYWLFKELVRLKNRDDREAIRRLCRGWQQFLREAGRDRG